MGKATTLDGGGPRATSGGSLHITDGLSLPYSVITETLVIFAKRGVGKTHTASVLVEEMIGAVLPVCVIDPVGVWWGLRSSADGTGPGLPVTILGGEHADLPLTAGSGAAVADLLVDERLPLVLDLSGLSKTAQRRFTCDFMERLYHRNREPLHLVVDEADLFAPMRGGKDTMRLLGAYEDIVRRGRAHGLGCTSITQRPASLHTDIRSQAEMLIALRLIGTHDVAAIDEWVRLHASDADARELKASLPSLPVGTAWIWSPGWLETLVKVRIRGRRTFDSSATPKVGQRVIAPREFARVNPADLERMAASLQAGDRDDDATGDVRLLRGQVRELRAALTAERAREPEQVMVPVLTDVDRDALQAAVAALVGITGKLTAVLKPAATPAGPVPRRAPAQPKPPAAPTPPPPVNGSTATVSAGQPDTGMRAGPARPLKAGARAMLEQLASHHPLKMTRAQLAALAGIKGSGSTFSSYFSVLRINGYVAQEGAFVVITAEGLEAAGAAADAPPLTPEEIRARWRSVLKAGARSMLDHLLARYPQPISRADLAALAGINPVGSTLSSYLSTLRSNNLIVEDSGGIRAADVFSLHAAP
jgi:hypothetical protein